MSDTLRDQLLGLGFKSAPKPDKPARDGAPKPGKPRRDKPRPDAAQSRAHARTEGQGRPRSHERTQGQGRPHAPPRRDTPASREDIDLAKAYAIRAQREKEERIAAERLKQEQARQRREAKAKLAQLLQDKALNDANADLVRHFDYGGKIKRIHVNAEQLKALNAGELGVVQLDGRYLLVTAAILAEAEATFAPAVALRVDPQAPAPGDPYDDPRFHVPDDLVW
jgi:uncharacterized protein